MIPLLMKMKVKGKEKRGVNLWIPIFLIWILLFLLMILFLPFVLLASLVLWRQGFGKVLLFLYPMVFILLFYLAGLKLDIESKDSKIFFDFI